MKPSVPQDVSRPAPAAKPTAAVIVDSPAGQFRIAALTVLDRLVVSLHRAGFDPLLLVSPTAPVLRRARSLGISCEHRTTLPALSDDTLVVAGNVLATPRDLQAASRVRGHLHDADGRPLPAGCPAAGAGDWVSRLDGRTPVRAAGVAALVTDAASARQSERKLWTSLTSSSDGYVDRHFNRPVGRYLSKVLIHTPVSPNQVSLAATILGIASAWLFSDGRVATSIAAALILQLSAIVDCVDGDVARVLFKESRLGKWLDIVGDQVVHVGVFLGIAIGLWRAGSAAPVVPLGISAAIGVLLSFLVILRTLLRPSVRGDGRLQRLIDATTNRDFSVLLILFAFLQVLEGFLWLAAIGSHAFWVIALGLQLRESATSAVDEPAA